MHMRCTLYFHPLVPCEICFKKIVRRGGPIGKVPLITTQNGFCGDEPPPFDLTIFSSIQKYELRAINHSIP